MKSSLYLKLQERRVIQTVVIYLAGNWGVLEAISFFSGRYDWPDWVFDLTLMLMISGLPFSIIRSWFHGLPDSHNKVQRTEGILIGINVLLCFSLVAFSLSASSKKAGPVISDKSIAVLPFANLSNDPEQAYFSDGIAEDILNHLVKISDIRVKSRTSTLKYKDGKKSMYEIGQELGAHSILGGSIRKVGNVVRIVVQLVDATRDENLWSETYDREVKDILEVQSEIALEIARALKAKLTPSEETSINEQASSDITAYDYFLQARQIINLTNDKREDWEVALRLLNKAIAIDPKFAAAYALKGSVWYWLGHYGVMHDIWKDSTLYYASAAITLNPSLPDGYLVRSKVYRLLNNIQLSKEDLQKAYAVAPNDPNVLEALGKRLLQVEDARGAEMIVKANTLKYSKKDPDYYRNLGWLYYEAEDYPAAEALLMKGKSLDPGALDNYWRLAFVYRRMKKYPESVKESQEAVRINPNHPTMIDNLAWSYFLNGDLDQAENYWSKYPEIESRFDDTTQHIPFRQRLGYLKWQQGKKTEARQLFQEAIKFELQAIKRKTATGVWPGVTKSGNFYDLSTSLSFLGDKKGALRYLDSAIVHGVEFDWGFRFDPLLDNVRKEEHFQILLNKALSHKAFTAAALREALGQYENTQR